MGLTPGRPWFSELESPCPQRVLIVGISLRHAWIWTERYHHLASLLPMALLRCRLELNWLARMDGRLVRVTHVGLPAQITSPAILHGIIDGGSSESRSFS
jgi:hypothetical protein